MTEYGGMGQTFAEGHTLHRGIPDGNDGVLLGQYQVIGVVTESTPAEGVNPASFVADITHQDSYDELSTMTADAGAGQLKLWDGEWWAPPWAGGCFHGGEQTEWGDITVMGCALLAEHDGVHFIPPPT